MAEENKDSWSGCGQVYFHNGEGFGLSDKLSNIKLGKQKDILKILNNGLINGKFNDLQTQVLKDILQYRKEEGFGTGETDMVGAGNDGIARRDTEKTRLSTPRKRIALRSSHQKHKNLFRR